MTAYSAETSSCSSEEFDSGADSNDYDSDKFLEIERKKRNVWRNWLKTQPIFFAESFRSWLDCWTQPKTIAGYLWRTSYPYICIF